MTDSAGCIQLVNDMVSFDKKNGSNLLLVGIQILSTLLEDFDTKEFPDSVSRKFRSLVFSWVTSKDYDFQNWEDYELLATDKNSQLRILQYFGKFSTLPHTLEPDINFMELKKVSYLDSLLYAVNTENTVMEVYFGWDEEFQSITVLEYHIVEFSKSPLVDSEFLLLKQSLEVFLSPNASKDLGKEHE